MRPPERFAGEQLDELAASSAERKTWSLADALVAGDGPAATRIYLELRQGERLTGLLYQMARRLREAIDVAERLEAGESAAQARRSLRDAAQGGRAFVADVERTDRDALRRALEHLADLEAPLARGPRGARGHGGLRTLLRLPPRSRSAGVLPAPSCARRCWRAARGA